MIGEIDCEDDHDYPAWQVDIGRTDGHGLSCLFHERRSALHVQELMLERADVAGVTIRHVHPTTLDDP